VLAPVDALKILERGAPVEYGPVHGSVEGIRPVDETEVALIALVENPLGPELLNERLVIAQRLKIRNDRLVRHDVTPGIRRSIDPPFDALLEIGNQTPRVPAENLVAPLPAQHDLHVIAHHLRDHVLRKRSGSRDWLVEMINHLANIRDEVFLAD